MKNNFVLLVLLLSLYRSTASICGPNEIQVGDHCKSSQECLPYSASMYNVEMKGNSTFDRNGQDFDITFEALNLYVPSCVDGYIKDQANRTLKYSGSILKPTFRYTYNEIWDHCHYSGDKTVHNCQFVYTLFIQKSFYVNFKVNAQLSFGDMQNFEQQATVTYGNKFVQQLQQQQLYQVKEAEVNRLQDGKNKDVTQYGVVVNKEYSLKSSVPFTFNTQIVFYTSPLFRFPLGGRPYSYGSDLYAQIQVDQDYQAQGYEIEYHYATLNGEEVNCKSTELASDGSFNLIFHPKSLLYDTIVTLEIHYWFEKQNGKKFLE